MNLSGIGGPDVTGVFIGGGNLGGSPISSPSGIGPVAMLLISAVSLSFWCFSKLFFSS